MMSDPVRQRTYAADWEPEVDAVARFYSGALGQGLQQKSKTELKVSECSVNSRVRKKTRAKFTNIQLMTY
ncbi:UNVERIFIED_CONTAM: hypothetical protein FKN15_007263 [Acipenser sinensis]